MVARCSSSKVEPFLGLDAESLVFLEVCHLGVDVLVRRTTRHRNAKRYRCRSCSALTNITAVLNGEDSSEPISGSIWASSHTSLSLRGASLHERPIVAVAHPSSVNTAWGSDSNGKTR